MKRCPTCNRTYADETLRFCLDDGVPLIREEVSSRDPYETLRVAAPRGTDPIPAENLQADAMTGLPRPARTKRQSSLMVVVTIAAIFIASIVVSYFYFSRNKSGRASSQPVTTNAAPSVTPAPEGRWFVILGTYPRSDLNKANERLSFLQYKGYDVHLIDTDDYPNMKDGSWAVVMGPYRKDRAQEVADKARSVFSEVYVKSGW